MLIYPRRIVQEHAPSIPLNTPLLDVDSRPKNKKTYTLLYSAGFFMDGLWFRDVYLPRLNLDRREKVLWMLRRDPEV